MSRDRQIQPGRAGTSESVRSSASHLLAGLLALQRAAGNRAVAALVQRNVVFDPAGKLTKVRFTVGTDVDAGFAQTAKGAVADGRFDANDLLLMQSAGVGSGDESFDDEERTFTAALLEKSNVAVLRKTPFAAHGDIIEFPAATVTAARRTKVANIGRATPSRAVTDEQQAMAKAVKKGDYVGAAKHMLAMDVAAEKQILSSAGTFAPAAQAALDLGRASGLLSATVLTAMLGAASDSTDGDRALAAAVFVVAHIAGSSVEADLLAGRVKVDEVPHAALPADEWAAYQPAGSRSKGDTIYLPSDFDPTNLAHRGAVVHELTHVMQDKQASPDAGPKAKVQTGQIDTSELAAYRGQTRFLLGQIAGLAGAARAAAITESASIWNLVIGWAMAFEARSDSTRFEPILRAIDAAAPPRNRLGTSRIAWTMNAPVADLPKIETVLLQWIRSGYKIKTAKANLITQDGLGGESLLDWITRPI